METLLSDLFHEHRALSRDLHALHVKMELEAQRTASNFLRIHDEMIALKGALKQPRGTSFADLMKPIWIKVVIVTASALALGSGKVTEGSAKLIVELLKSF